MQFRADKFDHDLLKPREVAEIFGVTVTTLAWWVRAGDLPCVMTPGGHRRYRRADVRALVEKKNAFDPVRATMEEDAVRLYGEGWSIRQVAKRFECSYGAMRHILAKHSALRNRTTRDKDPEG